MKKTFPLIFFLLASCAPLLRTNTMLKPYVGKSIDTFIHERVVTPYNVMKLKDGSETYEFHGGPGGSRCRYFIVTDPTGIIVNYRFENC